MGEVCIYAYGVDVNQRSYGPGHVSSVIRSERSELHDHLNGIRLIDDTTGDTVLTQNAREPPGWFPTHFCVSGHAKET